jgi:hypothetical protein
MGCSNRSFREWPTYSEIGAEAGFVVGLISGVISIIEATKTVYDTAKDAKGQPEAFRQVAAGLPLVIDILRSAKVGAQALHERAQCVKELITLIRLIRLIMIRLD